MVHFSRTILSTLVAAGALLPLSAGAAPAFADEYLTNLGPVGPNEPILATLGGQRFIAFFVPERGSCAVNTIIWRDTGADAPYTASRVRLSSAARRDGSHRRCLHVDEPALRRRRLDPCSRGSARYPRGCQRLAWWPPLPFWQGIRNCNALPSREGVVASNHPPRDLALCQVHPVLSG